MSFDILVFDPATTPRDAAQFRAWYDKQTDWRDEIDYNNPANGSAALQGWLTAMAADFPPLNGPLATDDYDNERLTDYSIGPGFIYACFPWSAEIDSRAASKSLAAANGLGFYDVSTDTGEVIFPDGHTFLATVVQDSKPWWRFW